MAKPVLYPHVPMKRFKCARGIKCSWKNREGDCLHPNIQQGTSPKCPA